MGCSLPACPGHLLGSQSVWTPVLPPWLCLSFSFLLSKKRNTGPLSSGGSCKGRVRLRHRKAWHMVPGQWGCPWSVSDAASFSISAFFWNQDWEDK